MPKELTEETNFKLATKEYVATISEPYQSLLSLLLKLKTLCK